ncbi:hypothetical protein DH2020_030963 [Rehmannia glutinosa]|uniref:NPH3 domain-containing protein n=1 Tax=Rehmannia glutinosa TaxID=99300 RepID=A0ABR0VJJ9_REHGL
MGVKNLGISWNLARKLFLLTISNGSIPAIKLSTYRRRLNTGNEAALDAGNPRNVSSVKRNMGSEFSRMIKEAKFLGLALGIPCLDGIEEAEAQFALINSESLCDGCFTSDSDAFFVWCEQYIEISVLEKAAMLSAMKWMILRGTWVTLAILLGSDYTQGESACQIVKSIGDSAVLQRFASEGLSIAKKQKSSNKKGQTLMDEYKEKNADHDRDLNRSKFNLLQVIDAYLKPKCYSADSEVVQRVLALYPFNRSQLHQICAQFFDWSPKRQIICILGLDEYILPKIAERNLRRFANLRSTSSKLGVHLPVNEHCQAKKIPGRDYFEVSWEDMDGLKSSSVPADLVESACPEKILEFQQRKAQKQKPIRRSRPKKADKRAEMEEIDKKLRELLLEIEQDSSTMINTMRLNTESESRNGESSGSACYSTAYRSMGTDDIIDLTGPPPRVDTRVVSKCQEVRRIDVVELSDTDNDVSPEHARKARELRSFIANIRDEISY